MKPNSNHFKFLFSQPKSKYGSQKSNGFDSRKEERDYHELKIRERAGEICDLHTQVEFELIPKNGHERAVKYIADFAYREGDRLIVQDSKGYLTRDYIIKRKLFKWRYPKIEFRES